MARKIYRATSARRGGSVSDYRPTIRYCDTFRDYINDMFRATRLDLNQILRLVLFSAAHSNEFNDILKQYKRKDVPIPKALWNLTTKIYGWIIR
jgi:hypothetical protein